MNGAVNAPRIISWNITLRCPLKCSHCYVDAGEQEADGVVSTQEAFSFIDVCVSSQKGKETGEYQQMADFVQTTVTKTAVRELTTPIADVATFNSIVQTVLTDNPWLCTPYDSQGATIPRSREIP